MKRARAADPRETELERQRALIRRLIDLNGWSSMPGAGRSPMRRAGAPLPDNIIPFPAARKGV